MSTPTTATTTRETGRIGRIVRGCVHHDLSRRIGALSEARALVGRPEFAEVVVGLTRQLFSPDPARVAHAAAILGALGRHAATILTEQVTGEGTDRALARAAVALGVVAAGGDPEFRATVRSFLSGLLRERRTPAPVAEGCAEALSWLDALERDCAQTA